MKVQRVLSVITGILEAICFEGVIYGWASLSYVLEEEGYFGQSCKNQGLNSSLTTTTAGYNYTTESYAGSGICNKQKEDLSLVYTISSTMQVYVGLINGIVMDKFGTWVARSINITLFVGGCFLTAGSSVETSWFLFISMAMISVSGFNLLISNMQTGSLFHKNKATIITFINGAYDSSSTLFLLFKLLWENGIGINTCFFFLGTFSTLLYLRTFFLLPKRTLPAQMTNRRLKFGYKELPCWDKDGPTPNQEDVVTTSTSLNESSNASKSLKSCILSILFWSNLFYLVINQFRKAFFISTFTSFIDGLVAKQGGNSETYVNVFGILQFMGIFLAPLNGILIDFIVRRFSKKMPKELATLRAVAFSATVTSIISTLYSITAVIPVLELQYFTFLLYVMGRAFLYGGNSAFISLVFPACHFGKIYGLTMAMAGLFQLLQYPVFVAVSRVYDNDFTVVNSILCAFCAISIIHPIIIYFQANKRLKKWKLAMDKRINIENTTTEATV